MAYRRSIWQNLLTMAEVVAIAGAERKESRGGHFRDDYPNKEEKWGGVNIRIDKAADGRRESDARAGLRNASGIEAGD